MSMNAQETLARKLAIGLALLAALGLVGFGYATEPARSPEVTTSSALNLNGRTP